MKEKQELTSFEKLLKFLDYKAKLIGVHEISDLFVLSKYTDEQCDAMWERLLEHESFEIVSHAAVCPYCISFPLCSIKCHWATSYGICDSSYSSDVYSNKIQSRLDDIELMELQLAISRIETGIELDPV